MTWIKTIDRTEAEGKLKQIYDRIKPDENADIPEVLKKHSLNPEVLRGHVKLYKAIMYGKSNLSRSVREMIATVVSNVNECHY